MGDKKLGVRFNDWIYQQDENVAINRAYVSKFGIEIGSVTLVFMRGDAARAIGPLNLEKLVGNMRLVAFFIEILPLVSFFLAYEWAGLMAAAGISSALGLGLLVFARIREGRIAVFPFFRRPVTGADTGRLAS